MTGALRGPPVRMFTRGRARPTRFVNRREVWYRRRRLAYTTPSQTLPSRRSGPIARLLTLWLAVAVLAVGFPLTAVAQQSATPEQRIMQLINQARIAQGLSALATTPELSAAARTHAQDMAKFSYMEHEGRDGSTPQVRAARHGYVAPAATAWLVLEVISARQTAEAAANWLLSDRLHRGVLLRGYWREMGAAYVEGGPYGQFWVVEFGCRPNVLPVVTEPTASGGVTLRLTNEECTPGGTSEAIGKATEVMVSEKPDFDGAVWEPFAATKTVASSGNVFVRYRDAKGRSVTTSTQAMNGANPVTVTAASSSTGTLNSASPPASTDASGAGLFSPKPTFVFEAAKP